MTASCQPTAIEEVLSLVSARGHVNAVKQHVEFYEISAYIHDIGWKELDELIRGLMLRDTIRSVEHCHDG